MEFNIYRDKWLHLPAVRISFPPPESGFHAEMQRYAKRIRFNVQTAERVEGLNRD